MTFTFPIWLAGLLPWSALTIWLLSGRRRRVFVPFVALWRGPVLMPRPRRAMHAPPVALALALAAILLAILAAAGPVLRGPGGSAAMPVYLILDRGNSMSCRHAGVPRFRQAAALAGAALAKESGPATLIELIDIPSGETRITTAAQVAAIAGTLPSTALDTQLEVQAATSRTLRRRSGLLLVLSDHPLGTDDPSLVQICPDGEVRNVAIIGIAARSLPRPQLMVRVRNDSSLADADLQVTSAAEARQSITLPERGRERDYFINVSLGPMVQVDLEANDDFPADNRAWLLREGAWPKLEPRMPLTPELQRMVAVYQKARPASDASPIVALVDGATELPPLPAVVVSTAAEASEVIRGPLNAVSHPITSHVNGSSISDPIRVRGKPRAGWTVLLKAGGRALVAVNAAPARQVWFGLDRADWAGTADFVIFWTDVFDWVGQGGERYAAYPLAEAGHGWRRVSGPGERTDTEGQLAGIYERSDGARRAFNPAKMELRLPPAMDWRGRLAALARTHLHRLAAAPGLLLLALGCLAASAVGWKQSP